KVQGTRLKVQGSRCKLTNFYDLCLAPYFLGLPFYISYLLNLLYSAVLVNPNSFAAFVIFPLCFSMTLRIVFFSMALNFNSAGSFSETEGVSRGEKIRSFGCSTSSSAMMTARSMVYCSSRTLPG